MSESLIKTPGVFGDNGNFLLEREIGSGGMGGVYMGRDKMLDRPVAVKVMLKELGADADFVERFKKEAQAAAGRKSHQCDENFLRDAEKLLVGEVSAVLNLEAEQARSYLQEKLRNL